jgi:hypothetical protein
MLSHPSSKLSPHLNIVALINPAIDCTTAVLAKKCETFLLVVD